MYFLNSVYLRNKLYQKLLFISIFGGVRGINVSNITSKCILLEQVTLNENIIFSRNYKFYGPNNCCFFKDCSSSLPDIR